MLSAALTLMSAGVGVQEKPTFAEIEKLKYEAFSGLKAFEGRYDVGTLPAGQRQSVYLKISGEGRWVRVVVEGKTVVESAWTKDKKWLINHLTAQYQNNEKTDGFKLVDEFKPLVVEKGRANFNVADMGPRFNADPEPRVVSDSVVEEGGKKLRRVEAVTVNPGEDGEIRIIQLFDEGTWLTRRFALEITAKDKPVMKVNGFLREDNKKPVGAATFAFPQSKVGQYQKVSGG